MEGKCKRFEKILKYIKRKDFFYKKQEIINIEYVAFRSIFDRIKIFFKRSQYQSYM